MSKQIKNKKNKKSIDIIYLHEDFQKIKDKEGLYIVGFNNRKHYSKIIRENKGNLDKVKVNVIWKIIKIESNYYKVKIIAAADKIGLYNSELYPNQIPDWPVISKKLAKKLIKDKELIIWNEEF